LARRAKEGSVGSSPQAFLSMTAAVKTSSTDATAHIVQKAMSFVEEPLDVLYSVQGMAPSHIDKDITANYEMENLELASGGFGKVFRATDRKHPERRVAIKSMLLSSARRREMSENEVKIMKSLDHPNICKLFETYERAGLAYYVMELCEGKDLFDHLFNVDSPRLDEPTAAAVIRQLASALQYAHDKGIAHRDIKPENIMFTSEDPNCTDIKVIDWGVGHDFGERRMRHLAGTLRYCAPEVMQAESFLRRLSSYTAACDMWSVGVVLYAMLSGRLPFSGKQKELLKKMKKEQYSMAGKVWQSRSQDAKDLIQGLLKADPNVRFSPKDILQHPWITNSERHCEMPAAVAQQVLDNMKNFSHLGHFYSICVAAVVRQLGSKHLNEVHRMFCSLDRDGNGVLSVEEVQQGFSNLCHADSPEMQDLLKIVQMLDKDGSGSIDYNEFCAAAVGERIFQEESWLWAAFRSFDTLKDGQLSFEEIKAIFRRSDVSRVWHEDVLDAAAREALKRFDVTGDGAIDFEEFSQLMRHHTAAKKLAEAEKLRQGWSSEEHDAQASLDKLELQLHEMKAHDPYRIVNQMQEAHHDHLGRGLFRKVAILCKARPPATPQVPDQAKHGNA